MATAVSLPIHTAAASESGTPSLDPSVYARAERFLSFHSRPLVFNNDPAHRWIGDSDALWYRSESEAGSTFFLVQPDSRRKAPAFDHERMAKALGVAIGKPLEASGLPLRSLEYVNGVNGTPRVVTDAGRAYDCDLVMLKCSERAEATDRNDDGAHSPDGRFIVFRKGYDLWVRDMHSGEAHALTEDGERYKAYAVLPATSGRAITRQRQNQPDPPIGEFSPDGTKFITYRLDESRVRDLALLQHVPEDGSLHPRVWTYRSALAGGEQPLSELIVFDLPTRRATRIDHPPLITQTDGPILLEQVGWAPDGVRLYFIDFRDSYRELSYHEADAATGRTRTLLTERTSTSQVGLAMLGEPGRVSLRSGDFIWTSERDGWRHLYLYDRDGRLRNAITSGDWLVRDIIRVDERERRIVFSGSGREAGEDPYFRHVYEIGFDGRGLRKLTSQSADHQVRLVRGQHLRLARSTASAGFSHSGRYFIDSYSRPDAPTMTVIRDRRGRQIMELERARLADDVAANYLPPEPFKALAADGHTELYGSLFKPSDFDPRRNYPVIDAIYPGPQQVQVGKRYLSDVAVSRYAQSVAELGFIVIAVDGRGTPFRSRSFLNESYGRLGTAGFLEDHIAVIRELAASRPYMDLERVGVFGQSGGGFATLHAMLDHPDFFKVGVASAGNHELRIYTAGWGEKYQGPFDDAGYEAQASYLNAAALRGKLLLATGDMDDNVHPANTMRAVDALIRANKDFDLLILPNRSHGLTRDPYFTRRLWDYFVRHLLGARPPSNYLIAAPR